MSIGKEIAALQRMKIAELRSRYGELFGETTATANAAWLRKRIAWRVQVQAHGGLSQRARQRAAELANDADLRLSPPKSKAPAGQETKVATLRIQGDRRLPVPGSIIQKLYKGQTLQVKVLPTGFEFEGEVYKSLSAVAKAITGQHCNGFHFFRLGKEGKR